MVPWTPKENHDQLPPASSERIALTGTLIPLALVVILFEGLMLIASRPRETRGT